MLSSDLRLVDGDSHLSTRLSSSRFIEDECEDDSDRRSELNTLDRGSLASGKQRSSDDERSVRMFCFLYPVIVLRLIFRSSV